MSERAPRLPRFVGRRTARHIALALASAAMVAIVYPNVPTDFILRRWNLATAYAALALLALSLAIGPWNLLRGRPNPVSQALRRDIGIWAGIMALVHSAIGSQIHMGGRFWQYFTYGPDEPHVLPIRIDAFGFANFTGLASTLILLLLLCISSDAALRRLGTPRWKRLQRWNYWAFGLMAMHAATFHVVEKRVVPVVLVFGGVVLAVALLQFAGYRQRRTASVGPGGGGR